MKPITSEMVKARAKELGAAVCGIGRLDLFANENPQRDPKMILPKAKCIIGFGFALKIEQVAGYYECKKCGHRYVPTYPDVLWAMHIGRTRYMKCPKCNKRSWQKKVISKE